MNHEEYINEQVAKGLLSYSPQALPECINITHREGDANFVTVTASDSLEVSVN